jgi:hypothetical protein
MEMRTGSILSGRWRTEALACCMRTIRLAHEYYHSAQAPNGCDTFACNKFATPTIANGRVYVGTSVGVAVFGLLP